MGLLCDVSNWQLSFPFHLWKLCYEADIVLVTSGFQGHHAHFTDGIGSNKALTNGHTERGTHRTVKSSSRRFGTLCREPRGGAASTADLGPRFGLHVDQGPPGCSLRSWDAGPAGSHEASFSPGHGSAACRPLDDRMLLSQIEPKDDSGRSSQREATDGPLLGLDSALRMAWAYSPETDKAPAVGRTRGRRPGLTHPGASRDIEALETRAADSLAVGSTQTSPGGPSRASEAPQWLTSPALSPQLSQREEDSGPRAGIRWGDAATSRQSSQDDTGPSEYLGAGLISRTVSWDQGLQQLVLSNTFENDLKSQESRASLAEMHNEWTTCGLDKVSHSPRPGVSPFLMDFQTPVITDNVTFVAW
ncbi:hypothetical protein MJG53_003821 [Ovis ammon polii x Ovis aries]|uniref:Uncharacterized protein n=1 Tax=Ovis ammon polii x Ovis aries TaxID=2918886 RepID=A0ACB9V8G1_9CETA|nr:hypothetical protein MJG53_003821 [Ovis ammon polii x Ovis aries]